MKKAITSIFNSTLFYVLLVFVFIASIPVVDILCSDRHYHTEVVNSHTYMDKGTFFVQKQHACGHETIAVAFSKMGN